jgi:hypothetical protein
VLVVGEIEDFVALMYVAYPTHLLENVQDGLDCDALFEKFCLFHDYYFYGWQRYTIFSHGECLGLGVWPAADLGVLGLRPMDGVVGLRPEIWENLFRKSEKIV